MLPRNVAPKWQRLDVISERRLHAGIVLPGIISDDSGYGICMGYIYLRMNPAGRRHKPHKVRNSKLFLSVNPRVDGCLCRQDKH